MNLLYDTESGWPAHLDERMRRRISQLVRNSSNFKIGITNWPEMRICQYERDFPRIFSEMIVLYETTTRINAAKLEADLIAYYWDWYKLKNKIGGGGGRYGEGWYYLYIVRRRRGRQV